MKINVFVFCVAFPSALLADHDSTLQENGCWDGLDEYENSCLVQGEGTLSNGHVTVKWINNCSSRLYIRMCNERTNGSWDCGADGVRGGGTVGWGTYEATGKVFARAVGSDQMGQDWNCASEISNWNDN